MTAERWMLYTKRADFKEIARNYNIDQVTARIIRNRDVEGEEAITRYLAGSVEDLYSPHLLKDLDRTVNILREKTEKKRRIRIVGDYDIDGVCSTYLLYRALKRIGALVDYEIPDRIRDGYGINQSIIRAAAKDGVDTVLTCDNGIAAIDEIGLAKQLGMTVLVTDHHDIHTQGDQEILPRADAIVDPKQRACGYPFSEICGAMVAYKLVSVLYEDWGVPKEEWLDMMEFVAIATVGDVMKLQDENRIIVKEGLKRIGRTGNKGLKALIDKNSLSTDHITSYHIGYVIGPCINAGGRLETAKLALSLFLCEEEKEAARLATELKELNDRRKDMTKKGEEEAFSEVERCYKDDKILVVYLPGCHESLAGIIAGHLREKYNKPAYVLTDGEDCVKGSGRSIKEYNMFAGLVEIQDLFIKFGGHPMAAGLSIDQSRVEEFRRRLNENANLSEEDFLKKIWVDALMPLEYICEDLVKEMEIIEPCGQGNEKPLFAQKGLYIEDLQVRGRNRNAVKMSLTGETGAPMEAMLFTDGDAFMRELGSKRIIDVIYYPSLNEYNNNCSLQIVIKHYKLP